jgi:ElaB/YqjD/DUF883 family membrane-anchored ribosome-binding protein
MSISERTERVLNRAARGEADVEEIENCISATRADLDANLAAIQRQLSTDALIHQTVDYLRSNPGAFFANFGDTVKRNPVPVALLGVSLGWLMLSGRRQSTDGAPLRGDGTEWSADVEVYEDRELYTPRPDLSTGIKRDAPSRSAFDRVRDAMTDTEAAGGRTIDKAKQKMSEADEHARDVFRRTREQVARARRRIAQQPKRMQAKAQDMAEHHPFMLGAVAFVAGAAIAASLKRSRIEDEMMGDYRDQALAEAETHLRTELHHGTESMRTALEQSGERNVQKHEEYEAEDVKQEPSVTFERESPDTSTRKPPGQESQDRFH